MLRLGTALLQDHLWVSMCRGKGIMKEEPRGLAELRSDAQEEFAAPIPSWGRVRFRVTQSPGTAPGEELLTHTGTRGAAAAQSARLGWCSPPHSISYSPPGSAESQPCSLGWPLLGGVPLSCPPFSPGEAGKGCCSSLQPPLLLLRPPEKLRSTFPS